MFDLWSAVQWWDEWQLRILVLGSLGIQWFLLLAAPMRKYTIWRCFRICIWLAYISSDALAIYALATLFNRHARATTSSSCDAITGSKKENILEVLWAPILLIHLGGQQELTAYNIEDNELWTRNTVTLVSQVTVALYAFYKSWPSRSDWRLLASAIFLFIIGVLSFSEKPWALKKASIQKASIHRLASVSATIQGTKKRTRWRVYLDDLAFFDWYNCFPKKEDKVLLSQVDKVYMMFSDMSLSAAAYDLVKRGRADSVDDVLGTLRPTAEDGYGLNLKHWLSRWLRGAFGLIYTRANVVFTPLYLPYHVLVVPTLHIAAVVLFAMSDKKLYNRTDVKTTYILLCFTAALDIFAVFIRRLLYWMMSKTDVPALCETLPGYNLIDAVLRRRNKDIGWLIRCAMRMGFKEEYSDCKGHGDYELYKKVLGTVLADLVPAKDRDLTSYRIFTVPPPPPAATSPSDQQAGTMEQHAAAEASQVMEIITDVPPRTDNKQVQHDVVCGSSQPYHTPVQQPAQVIQQHARSNWILSEELQKLCGPEIRSSLRGSFDRSVLVWHLATDLCFRLPPSCGGDPSPSVPETGDAELLHMKCTEAISNYMAHLLNFHPDMMLTGSRRHLVTEAIKEVDSEIKAFSVETDEKLILRAIFNKSVQDGNSNEAAAANNDGKAPVPSFHLPEACRLARGLLALPNETRWEVMYKVWLGMLCYSASMCRGYLHAKSLGEGGEFLTFVWLVLSLRGAKTLADKLQMMEGDDERTNPDDGAAHEKPSFLGTVNV